MTFYSVSKSKAKKGEEIGRDILTEAFCQFIEGK